MVLRSIWVEEQYMGVKKIVILA
ncbi:tolA family protein, partial [Escherichia coli]|nr:tolA family protein [Escherichia coli]EEW6348718.1 tolA family protein [Escherichia coli]EGD0844164.1 tolA family protein [Escherichia coli]HAM8219111.1 tolA family protein [Escherichia coli]